MSVNKLQALNNISGVLGGPTNAVNEIQALDNIAANAVTGLIAGGNYLPIISNLVNLSSVTPNNRTRFARIGDRALVAGICRFHPIAAGDWSFMMSLPIPSNLGAIVNLSGVFTSDLITDLERGIIGDLSNTARISGTLTAGPLPNFASFIYSYDILP